VVGELYHRKKKRTVDKIIYMYCLIQENGMGVTIVYYCKIEINVLLSLTMNSSL
jgi:hypothetical protein